MPALSQIKIRNYRCLRDVDIHFSDLTVLVGPNASGKSTILDAISKHGGFNVQQAWQRVEQARGIAKRFEGSWYASEPVPGLPNTRIQASFGTATYALNLDHMREAAEPAEAHQVHQNGAGLINVFATLTRERQVKLGRELCQLVPVYGDLDFAPTNKRLEFRFHDRWNPETLYRPGEVSDGTMFVLAFLLIAAARDTPPVICIEEPERGLHPYLIEQVVDLLRRLARGELGKPVQVVMATQSAELLNYVQPSEVRFLDRDEDGATLVTAPPVDDAGWQAAYEAYNESLGSAWLSGALGAVPGRS